MANEVNESTKWLYEQLNGKGYNVGKDVNEFDSLMRSNADSRQWAYDTAKKSGLNVGKDIDEFSSLVGGTTTSALVVEPAPIPANDIQPKTETQQEAWNPTPMQKAFMIKSVQSSLDDFNNNSNSLIQHTRNMAEYMKHGESIVRQPAKAGLRLNPEAGSVEEAYITPSGYKTTDKAAADNESFNHRRYVDNMTVAGQLRRAGRDLDYLTDKAAKRRAEIIDEVRKRQQGAEAASGLLDKIYQGIRSGDSMTSPSGDFMDEVNDVLATDREYRALEAARREAEKRVQTIQHENDRQEDKDVGFWRGLREVVSDSRTWDFGLGDMRDAMTKVAASSKQPENRSDAEHIMIEQAYEAQQAEAAYSQNDSFWNRAGVMTGEMLPFMLDFAIIGGAKSGATTVTRGLDAILLRSIHKTAPKVARNKAVQWTTKALGALPEDLLYRAPLMTNTVQGMKTSADIIDRKLGDVVIRDDGSYDFSNDKTWGSAVWQGEANAIIENYSEMFGPHLEGVLSLKTVGKLADTFGVKRLSGILTKASNSELAGIAGTMQKHLDRLGVSDYFGEVGEEYYGQLWRTMLNLDDAYKQNLDGSRTNLFLDGQFHGDIWGGIALSMGLMGAGKYTLSAAAYGSMKHRVNKTDARASETFTPEVWEGWRERIDGTTNDKVGEMAEAIVADPTLTDEQRTAAMNYMEASLNLRGFNLASLAHQRGGEPSEEEVAANESYMDGYSAETPQEMNDAKRMLALQRQRLASSLSEDVIPEFDADPIGALSRTHDSELRRIASDYVNAQQVYEGMIQRVRDDIDGRIAQSDAMIDSRVNHQTGMIQPATMKIDDRKVYIVNGTVSMFEDGSGIDIQNSSESIIIRDAETGKVEFADPTQLFNIEEGIDAETEKDSARSQIIEETALAAADNIDGVLSFTPGDIYPILDLEGNQQSISVLGQTADENGMSIDGHVDIQHSDGSIEAVATSELQQWVDKANEQRVAQFIAEQESEPNSFEIVEPITETQPESIETPQKAVEITPETENSPSAIEPDVNNYEETPASFISRIPVDESTGEPIYEQAEPTDAWDAIVESAKGNEDKAQRVVESMVSDMEAEVKRLEKQKSNKGRTIAEKMAAEDALEEARTIAQSNLSKWKAIAGVRESRITEAQRLEAEAELKRQIEAEQEARRIERQARDEERASRPGEYSKAMSAWEEPTSIEERILRDLSSGGIKLRWSDKGKTRGLGAHLFGGSNTERRWNGEYGNYKWLVDDNAGLLPEEYAERLSQEYYNDYENDSDHYAETFGTILDVLGSYASSKDMWERAQELHQGNLEAQASAEDFERMEMEARGITEEDIERDRIYREQFGMPEDEWDEFYLSNGTEIDMPDEEYSEYFNNLAGLRADQENEQQGLQQTATDTGEQGRTDTVSENSTGMVRDAGLYRPEASEVWRPEGNNQESGGDVSLRDDEGNGEKGNIILSSPSDINLEGQDAEEEALRSRIEVKDDDWTEGDGYTPTLKRTIIIDGTHNVTQVDTPNDKGDYTGSVFEYDGKTFGDLQEVIDHIDSNTATDDGSLTDRTLGEMIAEAEAEVNTDPTDKQKEAGNYKKGHVQVGTFDVTIENPKGSKRSGTDADGKKWETEMKHTYGYIRGTKGVDGDHIDVFASSDIDAWDGRKAFVVDQYNPDGSFDEHKVMLGFNDREEAFGAYLSNYESGWENGRRLDVTPVNIEDFEKWIASSRRKTKPFAEYKSVKPNIEGTSSEYVIVPKPYTNRQGKTLDTYLVIFNRDFSKQEKSSLRKMAKDKKGWYDRETGGWMLRSREDAEAFARAVMSKNGTQLSEEAPLSLDDMQSATKQASEEISPINLETTPTNSENSSLSEETPIKKKTVNPSGNKLVTDEQYAELLAKMRKKMGSQLNMGVDPEILAIGSMMAVYHIEKGARKFAEYVKAMVADLGEKFPARYLKGFYKAAHEMIEDAAPEIAEEMDSDDVVSGADIASILSGRIDAMATAEMVVAEGIAEQERQEAEKKLKEDRNKRLNSDGSTTEAIDEGNIKTDVTSGGFIPSVRKNKGRTELVGQTEEPKKKKSQKKSVSSQSEQPGLFGGLFDEDVTPKGNDVRRNDAGSAERLPSDNRGQSERNRENPGAQSQRARQEGERTDRAGEESGAERTRTVRPRLSRLNEEEHRNTRNNRAERGTDYAPKGDDARIKANIAAIELTHRLTESGEQATPEQMETLRKFSGWGGLGKAFTNKAYADRIRALLCDSYQDAVDSRKSAYYTPAAIIDSLWDIAKAMGFQGGTILEGSAGIGNILGLMPQDISEHSDIKAVEVDSTTGSILSLLYPDAQVDIQGFEETKIENGSIDLAITNVPFITGWNVIDKTGDKDLSKKFKDIHDFCIAKNIRKLREGGIGIFITSSGTLDNSAKLRAWVTNEGNSDVVGAFRLHNETFGGTGATSDIIVVRKRVNGKKSAHAIDVSEVSGVRTAEYDTGETKKVTIDGHKQEVPVVDVVTMDYNRYFVEHPEQMAGEMHFGFEKGETYRAKSKALYPVKEMNQEAMLSAWAQSFSDMDFDAVPTTKQEYETTYDTVGNEVKVGSMVIDDRGRLCVNSGGIARPLMSARKNKQDTRTDDELISMFNSKKIKGRTRQQCLKDYNGIKKALADVLGYQTTHEDNEGLEPLLSRLNATFDSFVSRYGNLHKNNQLAWLRNDVDYPGILALETYEERGDESGNRIKKFGKTDIFSRRVVEKETIPQPKNVKDGIITSLYISGRVDVGYISEQLGINEKQVREEIVSSGLGFENPVSREMEVSYEYLSGNVREKLRQATANNTDGKYDANIKALEKVVPMNIPAHFIEFALGSSWIEPQLYEDYVKERTGVNVNLTNVGGTWFMKTSGSELNTEQNRSQGVYSKELEKTVFGHEILEAAITNRSISVSRTYKRSDETSETIIDRDATQAVAAKVDEFRMDFKDWARAKMQGDMEMSARMETVYNDRFNNSVPRSIPDEFIPKHFGGQVTEMGGRPFSLRPHQAKAVIRGTTQSQLLAHEVGTGKTFTLISTAMEMRRLGTARKPMIVVQNATVGQFVESAKALYPNAKVLTLEDADRNAQGRKDFYAKIRYNDWDMIVIPQSVLDMIPDSEERQIRFIQDKIAEKMLVLQQMAEQDPDGSSWITKQAEKEISDLENDLAKITASLESKRKEKSEKDMKKEAQTRHNAEVRAMEMLDRTTDDVENFDQMGIDALLVDEAHEYKHLGFATAMQRGVKGVDPSYSKKAQGLYLKTQAVMERNRGRNVIFATGTPISNTAAEIWTFMRYLMPEDEMRDYGIYYFDDFVRNFGNLQQMLEFATNGKFKENNRFAGYVNLPELVRIWSTVTDTVLTREAGGVSDKIPDMEGGKAQDIYLPQTKALRSVMLYVKSELDRYDNMTGKEKKANSHIPLTMYGIAKAAAVDARLVYSDAADEPKSKTNEAVRQTLRSLEETDNYKGTVAIFADNYQNKQSGFNLYEDIRRKLIEQGIPAEQIVVMKSGMTVKKKLEIFDKVNAGEVRVILGSTYTLGTGVNIQERLHTLIHLDAPNRPMDYTQRNGRILRQGNLHKDMGLPVRVLRFGVEDSLDVTAYQRLKTKGAIADSIMNGSKIMENSMETRSLEEDEDVFGDITAQLSGSEYAMLKNQAEKEVRKLNSKLKQWEADQTYIHNQIPRLTGQIRESEKRQKTAQENLDVVRRIFPNGTFKTITIGKQTFSDLESMNKLFTEHNKSVMDMSDQIRDNKISGPQTRKLTINIDGLKFEVTTVIDKEIGNNGGNLFSKASRKVTYSCPELQGVEDIPVSGARLKGAVEDIISNVITGKDYADMVEAMQSSIDRNQTELQQIEQRQGKEFEFYPELAEAKARLEEYTEKMKAELAEKKAKYADMDADVEVASDISLTEEDSEETEEEDDVRYRLEEASDRIEELFEEAVAGNLKGKAVEIGRLTQDGRDYLEKLSGLLFKENVSFVLNPSDLLHIYKRHFGKNETDGRNIPLTIEDIRNISDIITNPDKVVYAREKDGQKRNMFFFLKGTADGSYNLMEIYSDSKGNLTAKSFFKIKEGVSQRAMLLHESSTLTSVTDGATLSDDAKLPKFFELSTDGDAESLERAGYGAYNDAEISIENDPWSKAWGESLRTKRQEKQFAEKERNRMRERAKSLSSVLGIDIEVIEDASSLKDKKQRAKGWYDTKTGKITVVLSNHNSASDMEATILHEAVAHHGLRQLLGEHFDEFLDKVYEAAEDGIKEQIDLLASRNGWNRRVATEEYLAGLAERTDFDRAEECIGGWFDKIKRFFIDMLFKAGFKHIKPGTIGDNELRYILWRSYQNLANPGRYRAFEWEAEDVAMQYKLQVGEYDATSNNTITAADDGIRFRDGDFTPRDRAIAAQQYERMLSRGSWQFREATQDSMLGLKTLYESILGSNHRIENVDGYENAYLYENRMSSANNGEQHQYFSRFMKPLLESIHKLCGSKELDRRILTDYMIAKHGLERNKYMRNEAAANGEDTERDFAGLCGLTGEDDWQVAETVAQQMVDDYEADHDTAELWNNVKKATNATLEKIYLSGLISEDTFNKVLGMYDFYIPLRGWDETTSDEVYGYLTSKDGPLMGSVFKTAEGRESKADDPIATIAMMADDAIRQGNRNIMKQRFLNFVHGNPSDLVSINEMWLQHNDVTDEWEPVFADLQPDMTHAEVESEIAKFEAKMEALRTAEPDKYKKGRDARNIPYKVVRGNLNEHQVLVKRNGRTYVMTINGNPRAAQALNGLTNPNVDMGGVIGNMLKLGEYVNRQLSAFYTTRNPDFVVSNFLRDMLYSNCMTWVKENPRYALRFHKNFGKVNPLSLRRLLSKWENDGLSDSNYLEKMFKEFMLNGGETGYTSVKDIEGHKRTIAKELKKLNKRDVGNKTWQWLGGQLDLLNRSAENCARFAAFLTSREMGRTLDRSIHDAKEVSVNFNKKGSGGKFVNATGQKLLGKIGSYLGGGGRIAFVFWNAGIQGMTNFGRAGKPNPGKALGGAAALFTLGYVIPLLAQMLGGGNGDDDDKNAYYNLPEYVRRSNICFKAGEQWVTIPLPIEYRAIYGMGELACGVISGNERYNNSELTRQMASQVSQVMPLDMLEGGGGISPFIPSAFKPMTEAYILNKGWTGLPVYKDTSYNKNDPEWTKAYQSADQHLVAFAKWLNETSGGNDYKKGAIDINPAKLEYLLSGTFGGAVSTTGKLKKMGETALGEREFEWRNMLLANRVIKSGDERTANRKLQNEYFKYLNEYEETDRLRKKYENAADNGILGYAERADFLYNSPEYLRFEIFEEYKPDIDAIREEIKEETDPDAKKGLQNELFVTMRELVDELHKTGK